MAKQRHLILTKINIDCQKIARLAKKLCNNDDNIWQYSSSFVLFAFFRVFLFCKNMPWCIFMPPGMFPWCRNVTCAMLQGPCCVALLLYSMAVLGCENIFFSAMHYSARYTHFSTFWNFLILKKYGGFDFFSKN